MRQAAHLILTVVLLTTAAPVHSADFDLHQLVTEDENCGTDMSLSETCRIASVDLGVNLGSLAAQWNHSNNQATCVVIDEKKDNPIQLLIGHQWDASDHVPFGAPGVVPRGEYSCMQLYDKFGFPVYMRGVADTRGAQWDMTCQQGQTTCSIRGMIISRSALSVPLQFINFTLSSIPRPAPPPTKCDFTATGGAVNLDHQSIARGTGPGSNTTTVPLIVSCTAPATVEVSIGTAADIPTSLPGLASKIAFDGTPYARNYIINGSTSINVSSTVAWGAWDSSSSVGSFSASGVIYLNIL